MIPRDLASPLYVISDNRFYPLDKIKYVAFYENVENGPKDVL